MQKDDVRRWAPPETSSERKASVFDERPDRDWLNPIAMSTLKRAVERKQSTVYLNGVEFSIDYEQPPLKMPVSGETRELILLRRTDGLLAPYGYVSVRRLQQFDFENEE